MSNFEFEANVMKWHHERAEKLRASEKSWLDLAGLFWLKSGDNTFGSASSCDFGLPPGAPKKVGVFHLKDNLVTVEAAPGIGITCNGGELPSRPLRDDQQEEPDFLYFSHFIMVVIKRGTSTLVRLWDTEHPLRKEFTGINLYPYQDRYRIVAKYVGYAPRKAVKQKNIIGEVHGTDMIGYVSFEWEGKEYRLDAQDAGDDLFIAFRDETAAKTTYAGGRYLMTEKPQNNQVVIDFNKTYNPPCAYTVYATCVLPTPENCLTFPIEAGEKKYQEDH